MLDLGISGRATQSDDGGSSVGEKLVYSKQAGLVYYNNNTQWGKYGIDEDVCAWEV